MIYAAYSKATFLYFSQNQLRMLFHRNRLYLKGKGNFSITRHKWVSVDYFYHA